MEDEWRQLLATLLDGGLAMAVRCIESQGRADHLGALHSACGARIGSSGCSCGVPATELWRLIPDLLAKEVVYLDGFSVNNCLWIQTLPSLTQADVLSFISSCCNRFRALDMELLAKGVLAAEKENDYWVQRAAEALLRDSGQPSPSSARDLNAEELPEFLKEFVDAEEDLFPRDEEPLKIDEGSMQETEILTKQASSLTSQKTELEGSSSISSSRKRKTPEEDQDPVEKAAALKGALQAWELQLSEDNDITEKLSKFSNARETSAVLEAVKPWEMDDSITLLLVSKLLSEDRGYIWSTSLMSTLITRKLSRSEGPASRILVTAVQKATREHPRGFVDSVLVPLLLESGPVSAPLADVAVRVVKENLGPDMVSYLSRKLFTGTATSLVWSEPLVSVVHAILDRSQLDADVLHAMVESLDTPAAAEVMPGSLKFANLLLCILTRHASNVPAHCNALRRVISKTGTFMTRTLLTKLNTIC